MLLPGRPIILRCISALEPLAQFTDHFYSLLFLFLEYISKALMILLQKLNTYVPPNSVLVTMDVTALYMNVLHEDGRGLYKIVWINEER